MSDMIIILRGRFEFFFRDPRIYTRPMVGDFCRLPR